jgi:hypothetical protein
MVDIPSTGNMMSLFKEIHLLGITAILNRQKTIKDVIEFYTLLFK